MWSVSWRFRCFAVCEMRGVASAGCPNIPLFVPYCSNFMTTTGSLLTHFVHLLNFKVLLHKVKKMTKRELSRQTNTASGQSF